MKNKRPASQEDIARIVGVSQRAVATVVGKGNPSSGVSDALRQRILEVAKELGYRPHRGAQFMSGVRSGLIGHVKSVTLYEHLSWKTLCLGEAVRARGFQMISVDVLWHKNGLDRALEFLYDSKVEGLLITQSVTESAVFRLFRNARIPIVLTEKQNHPQESVHSIHADTYQGGRDLTRHLIEQGFRSISFVASENASPSLEDRLRAYEEVMAEAGLPPDVVRLPKTEKRIGLSDEFYIGHHGMESLLQRPRKPEAVCFQNDFAADAALALCRRRGIHVPEDIALAGFDNNTLSRYSEPTLTSVEQPIRAIAEQAADRLVRLIRGEPDAFGVQRVAVPCILHPRASTGRPLPREEIAGSEPCMDVFTRFPAGDAERQEAVMTR